MTLDQIRNVCLYLPGTTEQIQWGDDLVLKVAGKMFLVTGLEPGSGHSFKCEEETYHELTELPGIRPAPYLARARWIQIDPTECRLNNDEVERLIRQSYDLVVAKLPKKTQRGLGAVGESEGQSPKSKVGKADKNDRFKR